VDLPVKPSTAATYTLLATVGAYRGRRRTGSSVE